MGGAELQLDRLLAEAERLAVEAGTRILDYYGTDVVVEHKADASPVTEADRAAERVILPALAELAPDVPIVSEEAVAAGRLPDVSGGRFWLVDPLDGTKEFIACNGEFTVNIALIVGRRPALGVVHVPATGVSYLAAGPGTARRRTGSGPAVAISARRPPPDGLTVTHSRSHADKASLADYYEGLNVKETLVSGSSIKFCLIAAGEADLYPRLGPTMEWDVAAGHAVLAAAGGHVRTLDGAELGYAKPGLRNPHFIARGLDGGPEPGR